jgi:hypothetical protein
MRHNYGTAVVFFCEIHYRNYRYSETVIAKYPLLKLKIIKNIVDSYVIVQVL